MRAATVFSAYMVRVRRANLMKRDVQIPGRIAAKAIFSMEKDIAEIVVLMEKNVRFLVRNAAKV